MRPGLKEGLFDPKSTQKDGREGEGMGAKNIFGELDDEENVEPVRELGVGKKTPLMGLRGGVNSPGPPAFASPTPSDKEHDLD